MNNLISALEELSCLTTFSDSSDQMNEILNKYELSAEVKAAIKAGNQDELELILGKIHKIVCLLVPAKEDDDKEDESEDDANEEKSQLALVNF